ncbi:MAG TPA: nitrophenyl compound nitroreductase subunit ArsF family protein [Prolixibacteraceae bacterium]|nr:nitrophenyl compound nitroreductase subunit ArsF family protein [Prolixibacteraceae bacterium]
MKKLTFLSFALFCMMGSFTLSAQTTKKETAASASPAIEAYYFHNTARCVTCKTVEAEAKADLQSLYGNQVVFKSLDLEEEATKPIAKKLEVSGQTLLVVKGNKKVNLTNEGFMYARTNPKKFKEIIKQKVDAL